MRTRFTVLSIAAFVLVALGACGQADASYYYYQSQGTNSIYMPAPVLYSYDGDEYRTYYGNPSTIEYRPYSTTNNVTYWYNGHTYIRPSIDPYSSNGYQYGNYYQNSGSDPYGYYDNGNVFCRRGY